MQPKAGEAPGQLYNLDADPHEDNNLYASHPEKVKELSEMLEKIKSTRGRVTMAGPRPGKIFNVVSFGAKGDGKTLNTAAIQATIDAAAAAG